MRKSVGLALLAGVLVGAAAGILLAPDKGSETRRKIKGSYDDAKNKLRDRIAAARQKFEDLKLEGQENLLEGIENASEEVISKLEDKLAKLKAEVSRMRD